MNKKILLVSIAAVSLIALGLCSMRSSKQTKEPELHQIENQSQEIVDTSQSVAAAKNTEKAPQQPKVPTVQNQVAPNAIAPTLQIPQAEKAEFTNFVNMENWQYNAKNKVYYQTGIVYAQNPSELKYQKMALFVPEQYFTCQKSEGQKYSCEINESPRINGYSAAKAPIVFEINSPEYSATPALTDYQDYSVYTGNGFVYAHIGFRGIEAGAPYGVTDIKAAVKYLHHNKNHIAGNPDAIFALGVNHGGLLAAVAGASGNSKAYAPYLQEIGALKGVDDTLLGVALFNPISGPDTANEALEWMLGDLRKDQTKEQKKISEKMAKAYADYINRAGFITANGKALTLQYSKKGIYQKGTYSDYIKGVITASLQNFINKHGFPYNIPKSWEISEEEAAKQNNIKLSGTIQSKEKFLSDLNAKKTWVIDYGDSGVRVSSRDTFNRIFKRNVPPMASFDGLDKKQKANLLFGLNGNGMRFDALTAQVYKNFGSGDYTADLYKQDKNGNITVKRMNMYNPLYYTIASYEGYNTSEVAPYWYIRSGLFQNSDVLTSSINLSLALSSDNNRVVDYQAVWGMGDIKEISSAQRNEFIKWISNTY